MNENINKNYKLPLVSIVVVTFNSETFIIDTLNSITNQTYNNIELIITDDCSSDNTVDLCNSWISQNKNRFVNVELITNESNTGTTANCNRGFFATEGKWIKFIAGDDLLIDSCIETFVDYCYKNPNINILFSNIYILNNNRLELSTPPSIVFKEIKEQVKLICQYRSNFNAQGAFINKNLMAKMKGFDESYKLLEDQPFWLKVLLSGEKTYFIEQYLIIYRFHDQNISRKTNTRYINIELYRDVLKFNLLRKEYCKINKHYISYFHIINYEFITNLIVKFGNKNNLLSSILEKFVIRKTLVSLYFTLINTFKKANFTMVK